MKYRHLILFLLLSLKSLLAQQNPNQNFQENTPTMGGKRLPASLPNIQSSNPFFDTWSEGFALPGVDGTVYAIASDSAGKVYVGGSFTRLGNIRANNIAVWNGIKWDTIGSNGGNGVNGTVRAIRVVGTNLFVGGKFTTANAGGVTVDASNIARWNGSSWNSLGGRDNGANDTVFAISNIGNDLYVGGSFTAVRATLNANRIARWNTANSTWSRVGSSSEVIDGFNGTVYTLSPLGNNLYAGGLFTTAFSGDQNRTVNNVAVWSNNSWNSLLATNGTFGVNAAVYTIEAVNSSTIYLGGSFTQAGLGSTTIQPITANRVALFNGNWNSVSGGFNGIVYDLHFSSNTLYATGTYTVSGVQVNPKFTNGISKWTAANGWDFVYSGVTLSPAGGYALAVTPNTIMVGGAFVKMGTKFVNGISRIDSVFTPLGDFNGINGTVNTVFHSRGYVYVGGLFNAAGTLDAKNVARWNISQRRWENLNYAGNETINGVDGEVFAIEADTVINMIYVAGSFNSVANSFLNCNNIAGWQSNQNNWVELRQSNGVNGVNGRVNTMYFENLSVGRRLFLGGAFTGITNSNTGFATNSFYTAVWTGSSWQTIAGQNTGFNNEVFSITGNGTGVLYFGGNFTNVAISSGQDVVLSNRVIRFTQATGFSTIPNGPNATVRALRVLGNQLVIGGDFTSVGNSLPANRLASLNTTNNSWSLLGTSAANGVNGRVTSIAGSSSSRLAVSGAFTQANAESGSLNVNNVALFSSEIGLSEWKPIGFSNAQGANDTVRALSFVNGSYWAVGKFKEVGLGNNEFSSAIGTWEDQNSRSLALGSALPINPVSFIGTASAVGLSSGGTGTVSVRFFPTKPAESQSISNQSSNYRWVLSQTGFDTTFSGQFIINLSQLPNSGIIGISGITVFFRKTVGSGAFTELPTLFFVSTNQLRVTFNSTGEFALGGLPGTILDVNDSKNLRQFELSQNYPNPFNPETRIRYQLPSSSAVTLEVFDVLGRKVATLVNQTQREGSYSVGLNAASFRLSSGTYFYRLKAGNYTETKKMLLIK